MLYGTWKFSMLFCCNSTHGVLSNPGRRLKPSLLQSYVAVAIVLGHPGGTIREEGEPGIKMAPITFSGGSRTQSFSRMLLPVLTRGQPDRRLGAALYRLGLVAQSGALLAYMRMNARPDTSERAGSSITRGCCVRCRGDRAPDSRSRSTIGATRKTKRRAVVPFRKV